MLVSLPFCTSAASPFRFGWLGLSYGGKSFSVSGWEIAKITKEHGLHYYLLYLLPVGAIAAAFASLRDRQLAATIGVVVGGGFLAWSAIEVMMLLWRTTFVGLWLTLAGTAMLFVVGLSTRTPSRP